MRVIEPRIAFRLICVLTFGAMVSGCGGGGGSTSTPGSPLIYTLAEAQLPAKWTVLVYLDADNDLEEAAVRNFNQMEAAGSTRDVHVIVQMDRKTGHGLNGPSWTDTRRYLIIRDSDTRIMRSIRLDVPQLGELDMGNPNTLRDFVEWGKREFPADHYLLVVWDHGSGWHFRTLKPTPRYKAIACDDTSHSQMDVTGMASALSGLKVDVIALDACYMQQLEVAYELRDCADYLVASAATEPSPGYDYQRLLTRVNGTTTPLQMCQTIVQEYAAEYPEPWHAITQSAVDLSNIGNLATTVSDFADVMMPYASSLSTALALARNQCLDYTAEDNYHGRDLIDYTHRCAAAIGASALPARLALDAAFSSTVLYSTHNSDMPNANGLAIYVPPPYSYDSLYSQLALAQHTRWDEWLRAQEE